MSRLISITLSENRPTLISSSGASTSSSMQNVLLLSGGEKAMAAIEHVVFVDQNHLAAAAAKQLDEHPLEVFIDVRKRVAESLARSPPNLGKRFLGHSDRVEYVASLFAQEFETLLGFLQLLERHHVNRPYLVELSAQLVQPGARGIGISGQWLVVGISGQWSVVSG